MAQIGFKLRQIQMLAAVAHSRSFSAAAKQLNVSQSAISQHIAKLEASYNVQLFQRHSRPVTLTDAGRSLLKQSEQLLAQTVSMHNEL